MGETYGQKTAAAALEQSFRFLPDPMTVPVIWGVTVLLQEVVLDQFGHFKGDFIRFCQRRLERTNMNFKKKKKKCLQAPADPISGPYLSFDLCKLDFKV